MDDEEIEKAVIAYLKKKGFRQTELALQEQQNSLSSSSQADLLVPRLDNGPARYHDGYSKLRSWAYGSLDLYKHELLRVLYPVFIHCFMDLVAEGHMQEARTFFHTFREDHELMHLRDLQKLESILSPLHLEEMDVARSLRQSKVNIRLCEYSFGLLFQYLQKTKSRTILGIINEHINFEVIRGQPTSISDDAEVIAIVEGIQDIAKQINQKELRWGLLEDSVEGRLERALADFEKAEEENKEVDLDDKKVWDMSKIGQPAKTSNMQGENESVQNEHLLGSDEGKRSYTLFQGHAGPVYSAAFSPMGDFLLSSSSDSTIRLWSTNLNSNLVCYKGHNYPVWNVQFSPVGHYFASSSHDRTARIWSMDRIQPLRIMAGHLSDVDCVQWHVNCNYIATGSSDKTVRLWDVQSGECVRIFIGHRSMVLSLAMSPDGRYMASGAEDGTIMMWDLSSGRCVSPLMGHNSCVWTLAFSCEGTLLASGSADCTIKLWDVSASSKAPRMDENKATSGSRLRLLNALPTKSTPVYSLRFSRRNLLFAAGALSK